MELFNLSITSGSVPQKWKLSSVKSADNYSIELQVFSQSLSIAHAFDLTWSIPANSGTLSQTRDLDYNSICCNCLTSPVCQVV